ncbi:hypothetical protein PSCICE_32790 [Pseudomonas cichorii]|nr:hypothetical protein PSCICE_32790 [Pseudomonas cichorii]
MRWHFDREVAQSPRFFVWQFMCGSSDRKQWLPGKLQPVGANGCEHWIVLMTLDDGSLDNMHRMVAAWT